MLLDRLKTKLRLFGGFVVGMIILILSSFLQYSFLGLNSFEIKALIGPALLGGVGGAIIAYLFQKMRIQNDKLKESEAKFQTMIDLSLDGIYLESERGEILDCNTMGHEMFGYTREEMLTLSIKDLVPTEFADLLPEIIPDEMATGDVYLERENRKKDGSIFPTEINTKFVSMQGEKRLIAYVRDITERKKIESELKEAIATKDKLFSIIGHDLKGAFNVILGFSDLLLSKNEQLGSLEDREFLGAIQEASKNANQLLENLLDWAFVQTGRLHVKIRSFDLSKLIDRVFSQVSERARYKNISIVNEVDRECLVWTDERLLKTVIRNLLANAIKYSYEGGKIFVSSTIKNNKLIVEVKDEGIGMTAETVDRLFDSTQSVLHPGTNDELGTGLGLIICKDFIGELNGSIHVESEPGKGSRFFIELPVTENN